MAIQSRSSVLAIVPEVIEGTPVAPTASGQYLAMQDGFSLTPAFDVLENAELKSSIGRAKSILGAENPSGSFSHYLRHSGDEGTAPNYGPLMKAMLGSEAVELTEYDTVAASTVSAVNVDTGEGASFARGQAIMVKDGTNGYAIRPIHSTDGDVVTPGFNLNAAPGTGVNLGKAVTYSPANTGHQSLSAWHYAGNSGAIELVAGARVTSMTIDFTAGNLINASFSLEGLEYYFNPVEIVAEDAYVDFTDDDGTFAAAVAVTMYKDPHELASALQTAMNATATTVTHEVSYSDTTGKFTFTSDSTVLSLLWSSGTNAANTIANKIGFSAAADDTSATTYTSDSALDFSSPQDASYDDADPLAAKANEVLIGDATDTTVFEASTVSVSITNSRRAIASVAAASGRSGSIISGREVTVSISALLEQYDADKFRRFRENTETRFAYNFGTKSGGNWVAGKCGCLYMPTATISSFSVSNDDGLVSVNIELRGFVDSSGNGEIYLSFV